MGIANPHEAVMMASLNPAKSVHIDDVCGQIREGYDADFIVLDQNLDLVATYLDGVKTLPGDELDSRIEDRILPSLGHT